MPAPKPRCEPCGVEMEFGGEVFNERGFVIKRTYECPSCRARIEERPPFAYGGAIG